MSDPTLSDSARQECNGPRDCSGTEQGCVHCDPGPRYSDPPADLDSLNASAARINAMHDKLADANATTLHLRSMDVSGKKALATHVRQWHGTRRNETPFALLVKWSLDELQNTHEELHR